MEQGFAYFLVLVVTPVIGLLILFTGSRLVRRFIVSRNLSEVTKSAVWALGISVPVSLFGALGTWGLVQSGGVITLIVFLPAIGALWLFGSMGPLPISSNALILTMAFIAQFLGYFVVVLAVRAVRQKIRR